MSPETRALIKDVTFEDIDVYYGVRGIVLYAMDGGPVENIAWLNIRMSFIDWVYETHSGAAFHFNINKRRGKTPVRNCLVENVSSDFLYRSQFAGLERAPLNGVRIRNIQVVVDSPKKDSCYLFEANENVELLNPESPVPVLEDKVHLCFIRTDWDGPNFYLDRFRKLWDDTVTHGKFPLAWQFGPTSFDLIPDVMDWYCHHATPNDYFVDALTGIGYIHEENYATMYPEENQKHIWKDYLRLSEIYRERMNSSILTTNFDMSDDKMKGLTRIGF